MNKTDAFRWISVALAMILGLGVARLLTAGVAQFHARRHRTLDWLPLAWAVIIFCQQLAFWWTLEDLSSALPLWSIGSFLILVALVLLLFLAAALILPHSDSERIRSLRDFFEQDGRWALPVLAAFNAVAILANLVLWHAPLMSAAVGLNLAAFALPVIAFVSVRRVQVIATATYLAIALYGIAALSPASY